MFVFDCALGFKVARFPISSIHSNPAVAYESAKQEAEQLFRFAFGQYPEAIALVPSNYQ